MVKIILSKVTMIAMLCLLITPIVYAPIAEASGGLNVAPRRVVFKDNIRSTSLQLSNRSDTRKTYRISFVNSQMNEDGTFRQAAEDEEGMFADNMLRFSPRQITIEPGQQQTVRVMLRKKRGLEQGEYRSHLQFLEVPDEDDGQTLEQEFGNQEAGVGIQIMTVYGISLPVIIRQGELSASVELNNITLKQNENHEGLLSMDIHRSGNQSVYGEILVYHRPAGSDEKREISALLGISVLPPLEKRNFSATLPRDVMTELKSGSLEIVYKDRETFNSETVYASATLQLK